MLGRGKGKYIKETKKMEESKGKKEEERIL